MEDISTPQIRQTLDKIIRVFKEAKTHLVLGPGYPKSNANSTRINAENISDLSFNHLFDDCPETFEISEHDAWSLRAYFTEGVISQTFAYVQEMHDAYPFLDDEEPYFIERVNRKRNEIGLKPLTIPNSPEF